jgi:hypothetical protein
MVSSVLVLTPMMSFAKDHNKDHKKHEKNNAVHQNKWAKDHLVARQISRSTKAKRESAYRNSTWRRLTSQSKHRQSTKNEWRNIATAAGALAVLGAIKHDNTLMFVGAAGALYSLDRYEKDRKSQSRTDRLRAAYFSKRSFVRDGRQYKRKTVVKNGHKYYQFVRV